jgi:hypothetical protein
VIDHANPVFSKNSRRAIRPPSLSSASRTEKCAFRQGLG